MQLRLGITAFALCLNPIIRAYDPNDYLGLVKKAVTSSEKYRGGNIDPLTFTNTGPQKWLGRARASLIKDIEDIAQIQEYYRDKEGSTTDNQVARFNAAQMVGHWNILKAWSRDVTEEQEMMDVTSRYAARLRELDEAIGLLSTQNGSASSELERLIDERQIISGMRNMWSSTTLNEALALLNAKFELTQFKQAWEKEIQCGQVGIFDTEMKNHAMNAIAWNHKARILHQSD